jgi:transcriptional regulator with XRE-family HTH domain
MRFSDVIKAAMKSKGLKIVDLSRLSGISYPYLADLIKGRRRWNEETINRACKALGLKLVFEEDADGAA